MTELRFQFEVFEGPLDLLLHLVRKEEVDIYEVDMVRIADQFCEYVDLMKSFDLHVAGEFIVMASTLMYIKSKELLPVDQQVVVDEEDEDEDPRWDLIRQLVEYRKFKDASILSGWNGKGSRVFCGRVQNRKFRHCRLKKARLLPFSIWLEP